MIYPLTLRMRIVIRKVEYMSDKKPKPRMKTIRVLNHPLYGDYDMRITLKEFNRIKKYLKTYIEAQQLLENIK
jgi:hypothetical protein